MIIAIMVLSLLGVGCVGMLSYDTLATGTNVCDSDIEDELKEMAGCKLEKDDTAIPLVIKLIETVLMIVGILTVVIIVYGGISYVISVGDAMKIRRAQNTILYGVIGMVIAMLAYAIVYFVSRAVWG